MNRPDARTWVEVDLGKIRRNFRVLSRLAEPAQPAAVIKSEAYGHGLLEVARATYDEGAWGFCVVYAEEGYRLRQEGFTCPILLVGPLLEFEMEQAVLDRLQLAVYSVEQARQLSRVCQKLGREATIHLKIDTGLARLSAFAEDAAEFVETVRSLPGLKIVGVYSHFADAEGLDQSYTLLQYRRFHQFLKHLERSGVDPGLRHISASAAAMLLKEARLDLVRLGISLYGLWPAEETRLLLLSRGRDLLDTANQQLVSGSPFDLEDLLEPALAFKTVCIQVKSVPTGCKVGYGCTYETQRPTKIAVLPVGYAEGYDRHLSNCGEVLIRGRRARVLGRICMNLTVVDVTDIEGAQAGDEVVLIGRQCQQEIRAEELAAKVGTIHYEIVTRIPTTVPRLYLNPERSGEFAVKALWG